VVAILRAYVRWHNWLNQPVTEGQLRFMLRCLYLTSGLLALSLIWKAGF